MANIYKNLGHETEEHTQKTVSLMESRRGKQSTETTEKNIPRAIRITSNYED